MGYTILRCPYIYFTIYCNLQKQSHRIVCRTTVCSHCCMNTCTVIFPHMFVPQKYEALALHGVLWRRVIARHLPWYNLIVINNSNFLPFFFLIKIQFYFFFTVTGPLKEKQIAYICRETLQVRHFLYSTHCYVNYGGKHACHTIFPPDDISLWCLRIHIT